MIVEFPTAKTAASRAAKRAAASRPRNSKNGAQEKNGSQEKWVAARARRREEKSLAWFRDFGHRLRITRSALGITEADAAAACLITLPTYRRREAGWPFRGWHRGLSSFVHKYDLTYDWMLCGEGKMYIDRATKDARDQRRQSRPALTVISVEKQA